MKMLMEVDEVCSFLPFFNLFGGCIHETPHYFFGSPSPTLYSNTFICFIFIYIYFLIIVMSCRFIASLSQFLFFPYGPKLAIYLASIDSLIPFLSLAIKKNYYGLVNSYLARVQTYDYSRFHILKFWDIEMS